MGGTLGTFWWGGGGEVDVGCAFCGDRGGGEDEGGEAVDEVWGGGAVE